MQRYLAGSRAIRANSVTNSLKDGLKKAQNIVFVYIFVIAELTRGVARTRKRTLCQQQINKTYRDSASTIQHLISNM